MNRIRRYEFQRLAGLTTGMVSGAASSGRGKGVVAVWRNNGSGGFGSVPCGLPEVHSGSVTGADLDGDGDLDVVLTGKNYDRGYLAVVGRNDGGALNAAGLQVGRRNESRHYGVGCTGKICVWF